MTAKQYLQQAYFLNREIERKIRKAYALRTSLYGHSARINETGGRPAADSFAAAVARVADYEREADALIDKLVAQRIEIEKAVSAVKDARQREVLERRYLLFETWEQIADGMHYERRQIFRLHNKGLEDIVVPERCH